MKIGTQSRSSLLIWNIFLKIADLDPKLGRFVPRFMKFDTWCIPNMLVLNMVRNWWSWPKIIDSGKLCPSTEICSDFYQIIHSQQIEHANYKYNSRHGLERSNDYWLGIIIGCKIRLTFWTRLIALTPS